MGGINMPEDQKISHLMKRMAEDLYQVLINSEVSTVDKFVTCCSEVDAMRKKRVVPLRYEMLPNVTPISTANKEDLSNLIRRIVKEEIEKVLPRIATCIKDGPSDLESIIREVRSNLTPLTREKPAPSPYRTKRTGESSWRPRPRPRQENRPTQQDTRRKTDPFGVLQITYHFVFILDDRVT
ncbi:CCHC-type domain-containing protein [Trichonephila inaurata madagascariensis]|uniref:CCHC-type domain-containing protein n=1 Tax=Trichonephila inaurata madagascariensis TaxID=2747483 RepID=A0A8X6YSR0_9ARAC|nr:CCHC-type domain-containing protein [Trichonephila inaurata madagascariensis]